MGYVVILIDVIFSSNRIQVKKSIRSPDWDSVALNKIKTLFDSNFSRLVARKKNKQAYSILLIKYLNDVLLSEKIEMSGMQRLLFNFKGRL